MISLARRPSPLRLALAVAGVASVALGCWIVATKWTQVAARLESGRGLHAPNLDLLFAESPIVVAHVGLALAALALGPVMLLSRKGAGFHRRAGWTWGALMGATAVSSLFIMSSGRWSYIHIMSGLTLLLLPLAVHAARGHAVARHRVLMSWLFFVMLLGATVFTLVPGRLIWLMFFG